MASQNGNVCTDNVLMKPTQQDKEAIFQMASSAKYFADIETRLQVLDFNVNMECDQKGDFLLHIAARKGLNYLPLSMALVKTYGADVELCNAEGMTPLMLAAAAGNWDLCDVLICLFEADPNKPNAQSGRSALHYAAEGKHRKTVESLIHRGADINMEDRDGLRADDILKSRNHDCRDSIVFNRLKRMEMISDLIIKDEILPGQILPTDLYVVDSDDKTLVMIAAVHNRFKSLRDLLKVSKSTMNAQHRKTGMTALAMAAKLGNLETVEVLLRNKAYPMIADMVGYLPLHHAVINNHLGVVNIFLDYFPETYVGLFKAMCLCKDTSLLAKLKFAWEIRQEKIVAPKLLECAISGHAGELFKLLEDGDCSMQKDGPGVWPLYHATENGHLEVLQLLHENGGDLTKQHSVTGGTLLHVAAKMGYLNIVSFLLQFCKNSQNDLPASTYPVAFIRRLSKLVHHQEIPKGCCLDINAVDRNNQTALQLAAERGFSRIVNLLLSNGATTAILDSDGDLLRYSQCAGVQVAIETHRHQHTLQIMECIEGKCRKALSVLKEIWLPRFDHHLRNKEGSTPLMVAALNGKLPVIQFLLESAVYLREVQFQSERRMSVDRDSDTDSGVLDLTTGSPPDFSNIEDIFEMSLDREDFTPGTEFHSESRYDYFHSDLEDRGTDFTGCLEFHQRRLTLDIDLNRPKGHSIYHDGLVSHVCAVNLKDGRNVLHYAIDNSDAPHVLALILEYDPMPLNMPDDRGETVLHLACRLGRKKSVEFILSRHDLELGNRTFDGHLPEELASSIAIQKMVTKARVSSRTLTQSPQLQHHRSHATGSERMASTYKSTY